MTDIRYKWDGVYSPTFSGLTTLADGSFVVSSSITNNTTNTEWLEVHLGVNLTGTATTSTGLSHVYYSGGVNGILGTYATLAEMQQNFTLLGSIQMNTNTASKKTFTIKNVHPQFYIAIHNDSGGAFTSATVQYYGVWLTDTTQAGGG